MRLVDIVINQLTVVGIFLRIERAEAFNDEFCMMMIHGKDDSLTYLLSTLHLQTLFHQLHQYLVNGIYVEKILENLLRKDVTMIFVVGS